MERPCRIPFRRPASNVVALLMFFNHTLRAGVALPHLEADPAEDLDTGVARGDAEGAVPHDDKVAERAERLHQAQMRLNHREEHTEEKAEAHQPAASLDELAECIDQNHQCSYWAAIGECDTNPRYMHHMCKVACRLCPGDEGGRVNELYHALEQKYIAKAQVPPPPLPQMKELSYNPRIYAYDNFLSDEECEFLKWYGGPSLAPSRTINMSTGEMQIDKVRTNYQMYINTTDCREHPIILNIINRMHRLARIPHGHGEALQIGRYKTGEFYEPHFDSEPAQDIIRAATIITYIAEPESGGETIFPKRTPCAQEKFQECCADIEGIVVGKGRGLWSPPRKGQAILFYSHDVDGRHNPYSLHGSCPVAKGEKWIAQQWFRTKKFPASPYYEPMEIRV